MYHNNLLDSASIDTLSFNGAGGLSGGGSVAQRLLANAAQNGGNMSVNALRTNGVLLRDEWKAFDRQVVDITRERLVATGDLIQRGLVYNLPDALGAMTLEWEKLTDDLADAEATMSGLTEATKDQLNYGMEAMPIPIIHKEFTYNLRQVMAARRNGRALDMVHAQLATRKVAERIEGILFNGLSIATNVGQIYGLTNHPQRNTGSVTASWATATGEQIVNDVIKMIGVMEQKRQPGPYGIYIPLTIGSRLGEDYKANSDKTILQRIMEISGVEFVQTSERITGTTIVMVALRSDVVEMIDGLQPTMIEWDSKGGFELNFKIIAIMLPRVRSSGDGKNGIVIFS